MRQWVSLNWGRGGSGRDQVSHHAGRRKPIPGGSGSAPASHALVMGYLIATLLRHRANSNLVRVQIASRWWRNHPGLMQELNRVRF